jgi:phage gp29-like protein
VERGYAEDNLTGWPDDHEQTPELRWPNSVEIYDRMRRQDAQVMSVLRAVTLPIRRTQWSVDPNGARDEVVQFCADNLGLPVKGAKPKAQPRQRDRFQWGEHLRLSLLMLTFGHSVFEQVYRVDAGGMARIRKLGWRPPRTITKWEVASDGGLIAIEQSGLVGGPARIDIGRLVVYSNDREGGAWIGQSLLRPAYKFWLLKDRLLRVQAQTVDRNGMGVPVYTASATPATVAAAEALERQTKEMAAGLALARGLRSGDSAGATLPNGAKMELLGVQGALPDAEKPIRYYDEQIARAVLAHFLNLGTETGSWALGSTFANFFTQSLQAVAQDIADVTTAHVIEDLVDVNWGPSEPAPRLAFAAMGSQRDANAQALAQLVTMGVLTADDALEQYVRDSYGLPPRDPSTTRTASSGVLEGTNNANP